MSLYHMYSILAHSSHCKNDPLHQPVHGKKPLNQRMCLTCNNAGTCRWPSPQLEGNNSGTAAAVPYRTSCQPVAKNSANGTAVSPQHVATNNGNGAAVPDGTSPPEVVNGIWAPDGYGSILFFGNVPVSTTAPGALTSKVHHLLTRLQKTQVHPKAQLLCAWCEPQKWTLLLLLLILPLSKCPPCK